jgi:hypothetical protein
VEKNKIYMINENGLLKIKFVDSDEKNYNELFETNSFGTIIDEESVEYRGKEIHIHTPAEHTMKGV